MIINTGTKGRNAQRVTGLPEEATSALLGQRHTAPQLLIPCIMQALHKHYIHITHT